MIGQALRRRVERLLDGEPMAQHLDRLFLYARDRCDGRETVQEIGDFVAHHNQRTKGVLTRSARDFFTVTRTKVLYMNQAFDLSDLPPNFPDFVRAMSRLLDSQTTKKDTGLAKNKFDKRLEPLISKFKMKSYQRFFLTEPLTKEEETVIKCLISYIIVKPAFTSDRLVQDFIAVLQSNGLLRKDETGKMKTLAPGIVLHALACMHQCEIVLSDGSRSLLSIFVDGDPQSFVINSTADVVSPQIQSLRIAFPIFSTNVPFLSYTADDLKVEQMPWSFPVQLGADRIILERM